MTTPTKERMRLDKFLRIYGSGVGQLVRAVGTTNQSKYSVDVRAHVRLYIPEEITRDEMIIQGDSKVIISSTEIIESQWPGAQPTPPTPENDVRVPRANDKFVWQGRTKNVQTAEAFYFDGELVKIILQVRGS